MPNARYSPSYPSDTEKGKTTTDQSTGATQINTGTQTAAVTTPPAIDTTFATAYDPRTGVFRDAQDIVNEDVISAITNGITRVTRRVEIYENDQVTLWQPSIVPRLIEGSIPIDSGGQSRRTLDITLDNSDHLIDHNPDDGIWYDKIVKVFRGVQFEPIRKTPKIAFVDGNSDGTTNSTPTANFDPARRFLYALGYNDITYVDVNSVSSIQLVDYDIIFAMSLTADFNALVAAQLADAFAYGLTILTINPKASATSIVMTGATTALTAGKYTHTAPTQDTPFSAAFDPYSFTAQTGDTRITALTSGTPSSVISAYPTSPSSVYAELANGGRWFHYQARPDLSGLAVTNLMANYNFENNNVSGYTGYAGTFAATSEASHSGLYSGKFIMTTAGGGGPFSGPFPCANGQRVKAQYWVRPKGKNLQYYAAAQFRDASNAILGTLSGPIITAPADKWTVVPVDVRCPYSTATQVYIVWYTQGASVNDAWYIDDTMVVVNPGSAGDTINQNMFMTVAINWLFDYQPIGVYETQVGEFMIDRITQPRFPDVISIQGRDYSKLLDQDNFDYATTFAAGTDVGNMLAGIASNAGVKKFKFNIPDATNILNADITFPADSKRIDAVSQVCSGQNLEWFFDRYGYMVVQPFNDPATSPTVLTIKTGGNDGNLVDYSKISDDSEMFNSVKASYVSADSTQTDSYISIAENRNPNSPTSIQRVGRRTKPISSVLWNSAAKTMAAAKAYLAVGSLEAYELDFDMLVFPWLEANVIIEYIDPNDDTSFPTRMLLTSLNLPLGLEPMSGVGKRVGIVQGLN